MHLRLPTTTSLLQSSHRLLSPTLIRTLTLTTTTTLNPPTHHHHHPFSTSPHHAKTPQLPPRPTLPDADLKHVYLKGSGPGGQKINKTSSAVQLTHLPTGIVVKSQATRSQSQNHTIARRILAEKIELIERGAESRVARKIELKVRRKRDKGKKARRKYRRLEEGKGRQGEQEGGDEDEHLEEEEKEEREDEEESVGRNADGGGDGGNGSQVR